MEFFYEELLLQHHRLLKKPKWKIEKYCFEVDPGFLRRNWSITISSRFFNRWWWFLHPSHCDFYKYNTRLRGHPKELERSEFHWWFGCLWPHWCIRHWCYLYWNRWIVKVGECWWNCQWYQNNRHNPASVSGKGLRIHPDSISLNCLSLKKWLHCH